MRPPTFSTTFFERIASSAINARMGAQVRVERNYLSQVGTGTPDTTTGVVQGPVGWWYGSDTGYWDLIENVVVDSPGDALASTTQTEAPSYAYSDALTSAEVARQQVLAHAGRTLLPAPSGT